jgi:hypothetical protein
MRLNILSIVLVTPLMATITFYPYFIATLKIVLNFGCLIEKPLLRITISLNFDDFPRGKDHSPGVTPVRRESLDISVLDSRVVTFYTHTLIRYNHLVKCVTRTFYKQVCGSTLCVCAYGDALSSSSTSSSRREYRQSQSGTPVLT